MMNKAGGIPPLMRAVMLASAVGMSGGALCHGGEAAKNRAPLAESKFYPLPLTSVKPEGWLRGQLRLQADGISGHLDEFWKDVGSNSAWLGGTGEGWERGPYYIDGLLPLAYLLDDPKLIAKVKPWVEWTLTNQRPDGGMGPVTNKDWWPNMIMLKVLTQYQEATGDPRVIPFMAKYFAYHARMMASEPLKSWAIYRWQDELASLLWLYNRTGDEQLLGLAHEVRKQGFNWRDHFENFKYPGKVPREQAKLDTHGVNNAMGLKTAALWFLISKDAGDRAATAKMLDTLDKHHGLANGMFSADEHLAGRDPSQGIELCAVVEEMFSLELGLGVLGDPLIADRLEKITYNALPATQTGDLWGHQYDQQPNQVLCSLGQRNWTTNGPESNLFGLEPNFGCCTANLHQGWPKFAASLWMATADGGLVATVYAPSRVKTKVKGVDVTVTEETEYPFRGRISMTVSPSTPTLFPLSFRMPAWTIDPVITVNGRRETAVKAGSYHRIERQWAAGDRVEITLPMPVRTIEGFNGSLSVERGPLVFALRIGENWSRLRQTGPVTDWEVYPVTPWNYGLRLTPGRLEESFIVQEAPLAAQPFNNQNPPVLLKAKGRRLPGWIIVNDSAGPLPVGPVQPRKEREMVNKPVDEEITLIPYGGARLRVTSFPVLGADPPAQAK